MVPYQKARRVVSQQKHRGHGLLTLFMKLPQCSGYFRSIRKYRWAVITPNKITQDLQAVARYIRIDFYGCDAPVGVENSRKNAYGCSNA